MKPHLVLVRGLPGSGKTRFAKMHYPHYVHWETDKLFEKDGVYEFDPSMLKVYHTVSQLYVAQCLKQGLNVIVANTFTQAWEMKPYLEMDAQVSVFRVEANVLDCHIRQLHGVPLEHLMKMKNRFETYEGETVING